jgi:hypothetical protein
MALLDPNPVMVTPNTVGVAVPMAPMMAAKHDVNTKMVTAVMGFGWSSCCCNTYCQCCCRSGSKSEFTKHLYVLPLS